MISSNYLHFAMKNNFTPTYHKVIFLILASSILGLLLFSYLFYITNEQEKKVYTISKEQFSNEVNSLVELKSEALRNVTHDLTFWDDYVDYIESHEIDRDQNWYKVNIESIGDSYEVDYTATFDIEGNLISENRFEKIKSNFIFPKEVFSKISKEKQIRYFHEIPEGILEIHAATIHPTSDPEKTKTKPRGYFIAAKLLDNEYFINLKKISSSDISILNIQDYITSNNSTIHTLIQLNNYNGDNIKKLLFTRPFNLNFNNTKNILIIILLFFILNLIINILFSKNIVYDPLNLIKTILEKNDTHAVDKLMKKSGEFGYIGNLFFENNEREEELKIAKDKAEESDRLKTEFLHNLSHEIRTPMNSIIGFSDLLSEPNLNQSKKSEYLKIINICGKNLVTIIDDLIDLSKIDANQMKPNYTAFDLSECLSDIQNSVSYTITEDKPIKLILTNPKTPLTLLFISDEVKLIQILKNLLNNAIKFTNAGTISFGYEIDTEKKIILFKVNDTGIGIDEKEQKEIFNRFKRIQTDETINKCGLGLGLAINKAYIEMLNGEIWLESEKNIGSVFSFSLPLKTASLPNQPENSIKSTYSDKNSTILVAEDEDYNFMLVEILLSEKGYKVIRANNGLEAVSQCIENKNINLVLMDIKMPKLSGLEAQKQIKIFNPSLPIIALSAFNSQEDKKELFEAGFINFLPKPLNKELLYNAISEILYVNETPI